MTATPPPEELIDVTGPEGESLFCHAEQWLMAERATDLQASLDATWVHYRSIDDERLLALLGALCVEGGLDALLVAFAPGFSSFISDTDFKFSVKIKFARSLRVLPGRILAACDLIRQIRNEFAHSLNRRSLSDLDDKLRNKLFSQTEAFNPAKRDPSGHNKQFKDLVGFVITALWIYTQQTSKLRVFVESSAGRDAFKRWAEAPT